VKHKRCESTGCQTLARYGHPGGKPTHCARHKTPGAIFRPNRRCAKCRHPAVFGSGSALTHCAVHRQPGEVNLVERICTVCGLEEKLNGSGSCTTCGAFPELKRAHLAKQRAVKVALEAASIYPESYDAILERGLCSRKRPDFVLDGEGHKLVVEVDEFQHRRGGYDCEVARMYEIVGALGFRTIFIRYNPDPFRNAQGKRQDPPRERREAELVRWVRHLQGPAGATRALDAKAWLLVGHMYYDGWDGKLVLEEAPEPSKPPAIDPETVDVPLEGEAPPVPLSPEDLEGLEALLTELAIEANTGGPTTAIGAADSPHDVR